MITAAEIRRIGGRLRKFCEDIDNIIDSGKRSYEVAEDIFDYYCHVMPYINEDISLLENMKEDE